MISLLPSESGPKLFFGESFFLFFLELYTPNQPKVMRGCTEVRCSKQPHTDACLPLEFNQIKRLKPIQGHTQRTVLIPCLGPPQNRLAPTRCQPDYRPVLPAYTLLGTTRSVDLGTVPRGKGTLGRCRNLLSQPLLADDWKRD